MTPPVVKRADAQRNRASILAAAEDMFAKDGLAVSVDDIATRAGVGIGTLYRHFPTKDALVAAIVVDRIGRMADHIETLVDASDAGAALCSTLERMVEEGAHKRDFVDSLGNKDLLMTPALDHNRTRYRKALSKLLARAQHQGAIRDDVQPADITELVKGLFAADAKSRPRLLRVVLDGLRARPSTRD